MHYRMPPQTLSGVETYPGIGGKSSGDKELISTEFFEDRTILSQEEIETEVKRINNIWDENQTAINEKKIEPLKWNYWYDIYFDEQNQLRMLSVQKPGWVDDYAITWQIENDQITFAYYWNYRDKNWLYFKDGMLFRWVCTRLQYGDEVGTTVYDNDFSNSEFLAWEMKVFDDYNKASKVD